jgi:hypothetical protein
MKFISFIIRQKKTSFNLFLSNLHLYDILVYFCNIIYLVIENKKQCNRQTKNRYECFR